MLFLILLILYIIILILISTGFIFIELHKYMDNNIKNDYCPETLVILPCRGIDYSLKDNLNSIKNQSYNNFKLICVVDNENEGALKIIKELNIEYITSDYPCKECSGKVKAISTAINKFNDYDVYVIADSDIYVKNDWLLNLIMPLKNSDAGLSTTFPYFVPKNGFWSEVKEVWGFVGMGLMESDLTRFGWGGSLAFKKELIDDNLKFFSEHISDDTALTKITKNKNLKIYYTKKSMPYVNSPENFSDFFEWANRQTALSISADKRIYYYGLLFYGSYIFLFFSAILTGIFYNYLFFLFLIPSIIYIVNMLRRLTKIKFVNVIAAIILPEIYITNLLIANKMKNIKWRGRIYSINDKKLL